MKTLVEEVARDGFAALRKGNDARQREWDPSDKITLAYRGNELAGEVGEACNVLKKIERERLGIRGSRDTVEHLAEELADVVICVDLICMAEGIDFWQAIRAKFNATSEKVGLQTRLPPLSLDALPASPASGVAAEGDFVRVPREPTEAMIEAAAGFAVGGPYLGSEDAGDIYRAMIAEAPQQQEQGGENG